MRSYPISLTHSLHKYDTSKYHNNNINQYNDPDYKMNNDEINHNNKNNTRRFRHRLKTIKSSSRLNNNNKGYEHDGLYYNGKRKRSCIGSNNSIAGTTSIGDTITTYCGNTIDAIPSSQPTSRQASKYRGVLDSDQSITVRKSVEFGKNNNQLYRYIDTLRTTAATTSSVVGSGGGGGGIIGVSSSSAIGSTGVCSTSTSINNGTGSIDGAIDVEDGYDGASERGKCEDDYPVDDDMASGSDNELPLGNNSYSYIINIFNKIIYYMHI